jgi:2-oxoglutarate dehydrogenase E1 component
MSAAEELSAGRFRPLVEPAAIDDRSAIRRLILCSGKFFYDLSGSELATRTPDTSIARVELLYPFPAREVGALAKRFPKLERVVWAQEEPRNMGALKFVLPELARVLPRDVEVETVARPERSSPAEGYGAVHLAEQRRLVREAFQGSRRSGSRPRGGGNVTPWRTP